MRGFTIGAGAYRRLAVTAAACAEWATGVPFTVLDAVPDYGLGDENPHAHKLQLPDDDQYLWVDADVWFMRRWSVPDVPLETFAACRAEAHEAALAKVLERYGGERSKFLNTGLFIASNAHRDVMRQAFDWMREGLSRMHEESVLNCALQVAGTPTMELPGTVNAQKLTAVRGPIAVHACAQRTLAAKTQQLHWVLGFAEPALLEMLASRGLGDFRRALGPNQRPVHPAPVRRTNLRVGRNDRSA